MAVTVAVAGAGCGASHAAAGPRVVDHWRPPRVSGPPSVANFCTLLVADYRHIATVATAPNLATKKRIVGDFVGLLPKVVSEAPATVAAPARLYLTSVSTIMKALAAANLQPIKVKGDTAGKLVVNPAVQAAGRQVISFSAQRCHYAIGTPGA